MLSLPATIINKHLQIKIIYQEGNSRKDHNKKMAEVVLRNQGPLPIRLTQATT